jgi:hypothetical protein
MLSVRDSTNGTKVKGVYAPDHVSGGSDWRITPGAPGNERRVKAEFETIEALKALTRRYAGDAHHLAYGMKAGRGMVRQRIPRANKRPEGGSSLSGMDWIQRDVDDIFFDLLSFDLDNPEVPGSKPKKKKPNTPESTEHWMAQLLRPELAGAQTDITKNGARVRIFFATRVYGWQTYEAIYRTGMAWINSLGWTSMGEPVTVDPSCCDATRLIRLPFVVREGTSKPYIPPLIDLRIVPRDFVPTWEASGSGSTAPRIRTPCASTPYVFTSTKPPEHLVPHVTPATLEHHTATRHQCMASAASMLLARGVPPEHVPSVVVEMGRRMALPEEHVRDDRTYAENTCDRYRRGVKDNTGGGHLYKHCSALAEAIDALSLGLAVDKLAEVANRQVTMEPTAEIYTATVAAMSKACDEDATIIIDPPAGTGKTEAVTEIALEVAQGKHPAGRSHPSARTAYVAPRQDNLRDYQRRAWTKHQLPILRLTSAASERWEEGDVGFDRRPATPGDPVCYAHGNVQAFGGAQNIRRTFCEGCRYEDVCRASTGAVDHENRPVVLEQGWHDEHPHIAATQARLGVALQHLGASGKLFSDERLELCALETIADDAIGSTLAALGMFEDDYASAMRLTLTAIRARIQAAEPYAPTDLAAFVGAEATAAAREADPMAHARSLIPSTSPPIKPQYAAMVRDGPRDFAKRLGGASDLLELVWTRLQAGAERCTCHVVMTKKQDRELYIAWTGKHVTKALTGRTATSVLLDASARDSVPEYEALLGPVKLESPNAQDSVPVPRRLLVTRYGSKSAVTNKIGLFVPGGKHVDLVRQAVERIPVGASLVIITWKPLALIMRAALGEDVTDEWKAIDQSPSYLAPLAAEMRPLLPAGLLPTDVEWYGAIRGLDRHKRKAVCVTIGDPIPSINATGTQAAHLALSTADASLIGIRYARAELGQAQERLRTKRRPVDATGVPIPVALALHVGRGVVGEDAEPIYPSGWEGTRFAVEREGGETIKQKIEAGRMGGAPTNAEGEERERRRKRLVEARDRCGSSAELASAIDVSEASIKGYATDRRSVPDEVDAKVVAYLGPNRDTCNCLVTEAALEREEGPTRGGSVTGHKELSSSQDPVVDPRTSAATDLGTPEHTYMSVDVVAVPTVCPATPPANDVGSPGEDGAA